MPAVAPQAVVAQANWYQFTADERVRYARVESRMLLWCKAGHGKVTVNGRTFALSPGDYLILPWGHRISYEPEARSPYHLAGVHVIPHHARGRRVEFSVPHDPAHALAGCRWRRDVPLPGVDDTGAGRFAANPALQHLAEYTVARYRDRDEAEMRQLACMILAEIARRPATAGDNRPAALDRMLRWVQDHLDQPGDLEALAIVGGCSVATARRMFHRHLGMAPLAWVSQTRLEQAEHLLRTTSLPIAAIAGRVGFLDPFYFSRWFRRLRGHSPRQVRRDQLRI